MGSQSYRVKRFSYKLGKNDGRVIAAFLHVLVNDKTGAVHLSQGLRYCHYAMYPNTLFVSGKWKKQS
jgi:hypothetical protein